MVVHYGEMKLGRKDEKSVKAFYRKIPPEGGSKSTIGPVILREQLGIGIEEFERCKKTLRDHGLVKTVQGGGLYRESRGDGKELCYYKPIARELELYWAEQPERKYHLRQRFLRVLDTHHGGSRPDGQWARPDLTLIGGKELRYLPGKFLDVITFEVKVGMRLEGVYEALAHRRRANFAYVVCVCPEHWGPLHPTEQAPIVAEATRQGIGVILVRQEDDFGLWSALVEPIRHEPDPQDLHDFLETHCYRDCCLPALRKWLEMGAFELPPVTDTQVRRLELTTEELEVAQSIVKKIADSDESWGPTSFKELGDKDMVSRVRDVLKDAGYVETSQGGAIRRARSTL